MKTIKHFALALVAVACGLGFTSCNQNNPDDYSNYPQLIVGKWFNFTPEASVFKTFNADGTLKVVGFDKETGWMADDGTYRLEGNKTTEIIDKNGSLVEYVREVEVTNQRYVIKAGAEFGEKIHYRVQEQFDIKGNYTYLNSAVRVVAAEGKTGEGGQKGSRYSHDENLAGNKEELSGRITAVPVW